MKNTDIEKTIEPVLQTLTEALNDIGDLAYNNPTPPVEDILDTLSGQINDAKLALITYLRENK